MSISPSISAEKEDANLSASKISRPLSWHLAALLLLLILFGTIRWRLATMPLERDEGEYAYAGQLMLEHIPPYKFAYNMKLPGTYAGYAAIMAVFGETPRGIHIGILLLNAATIILMYFLAALLFGRNAGIVAAAVYAVLSTHQATLGLAGHATHFVVAAALAGLILLLKSEQRNSIPLLFASGIFFGLAFLMKQPGALLGVFAFFYLVFVACRRTAIDWRRLAKASAIFAAGCVVPFAMTCLWLWRAGVFSSFWFWTFSYARQYSSLVSLKDGWGLFTYNFVPLFKAAAGLWVIAIVGLVACIWHRAARKHAVFTIGLLAFSFLAVSSGLYFRTHYFIMLLPAIALLSSVAIVATTDMLSRGVAKPWLRAVPLVIFLFAWGWAVGKNAKYYFRLTPSQASRAVYINSPFIDAVAVSDYLRHHTSPTDKLIVLGSEPEIYFYAHRLSASGYIYMYGLMEKQPYWQEMQQQMIHEVESNRPAYLVYFNHPATWLTTMGSSRLGPFLVWADAYLKNNYEKVGLVELSDPDSRFTWGDEARQTVPKTQFQITIFKRKN